MTCVRPLSTLCAALLRTLLASAAHATLIGHNATVALTDGGSPDESDVVVVGAGPFALSRPLTPASCARA